MLSIQGKMKKSHSNILNVVLVGIIILLISNKIVIGASTEAGSSSDPLVPVSYVEGRLTDYYQEFDDRLKVLENQEVTSGANLEYEVVEVFKGQIITLQKNTLFILRAGEGVAIGGTGGGLSDLTTGIDLKTNDVLELNHNLLIPQSDGRGVKMLTHGYVMISGKYSIK